MGDRRALDQHQNINSNSVFVILIPITIFDLYKKICYIIYNKKGVYNMLHVNVEELMKQGHSPEEIVKMISDEIYSKIEQEAKRKAAEEAKKAAEKELKEKKEEARKAAIAAAMAYYALVYPEFSTEDLEEFSKTAIDSVAKSIEMAKVWEGGKYTSILDFFG